MRASTPRRCGGSAGSCAACSRERPFDVVHACNPPDFLLLAARSLRRQGARFVFDHHDLVPELYRSRFGARRGPRLPRDARAERVAFRIADVVALDQRLLRARGHRARRHGSRGRLRRAQRTRPRPLPPGRARPRVAARARAPHRLPGDHGPPGRRRPRAARAGRAARRATTGTRSSSATATCCPPCARWPTSWGSTTASSSPAGAATTTSARSSAPRRLPGAGPAEPAQRRLDDDQDPRVHGDGRAVASYDLPESRVSAGDGGALRRRRATPTASGAGRRAARRSGAARRMGALGARARRARLAWQHSRARCSPPTRGRSRARRPAGAARAP